MAMTISRLAAAADVNPQTVRYYERRDLLPRPRRTASGYRQYGEEALRRLRFIRRAQSLGFSLTEIRELLSLRVRPEVACHDVLQRTRQKLTLVDHKLAELQRIRARLEVLAAACERRQPTDDCPILEVLSEHDNSDG